MADELTTNRLATLTFLASAVPGQRLGRTAAMKLMYFLQVLHDVPLGYTFRLHTYGPFDPAVLDDIGTAKSLDAISEKMVTYPVGYGYESSPGPSAKEIQAKATDWLKENRPALDSAIKEFGPWSASLLELGSTVVFVDREFLDQQGEATVEAIANRVREIKPHFSEATVLAKVNHFLSKGMLKSVRP